MARQRIAAPDLPTIRGDRLTREQGLDGRVEDRGATRAFNGGLIESMLMFDAQNGGNTLDAPTRDALLYWGGYDQKRTK